jgi:S-DNA-T family DNA segregation ATPase FtsK/SpoIIIE
MSEPSLNAREIKILHDIASLAAERAAGESRQSGELASRAAAIEAEYQTAKSELETKAKKAIRELDRASETEIASITAESRAEREKIQKEYETATKTIRQRHAAETSKAKTHLEEARWQATAVHESGSESARKNRELAGRTLATNIETRIQVEEEAKALLDAYRKYVRPKNEAVIEAVEITADDPRPAHQDTIREIDDHVLAIHGLNSLKILRIDTFVFLVVFLIAALAIPGALFIGWPVGAIAGATLALLLVIGLRFWMTAMARKSVTAIAIPLRAAIDRGVTLSARSEAWVAEEFRKLMEESDQRRASEIRKAEEIYQQRIAASDARRDTDRSRADATYPPQLAELLKLSEITLRTATEAGANRLAETKAMFASKLKAIDDDHAIKAKAHADATALHWDDLSGRWSQGVSRINEEIAAIHDANDQLFPDWKGGWKGWKAPQEVPPVIRFGEIAIHPKRLPHGTPSDDRLKPIIVHDFTLPALLDLRKKGSLLIRAGEGGRDEAVELLQAVMLRMITAIPPSKVRFTIVDPVGLGRSFASFMHLADFDEMIINHRIWTDSMQIDQRLKDLTDHMENVIQTYLRNDYPTIEDYNAQAGEVSEPYRVLVVANFPNGFTESAMKSLASIVSSGARCGVHCLISVDARQPMPFGFSLKDLESNAANLIWKEDRFVWRHPEFESYHLIPDAPPAPEAITGILHEVGKISKDARRVEVPFEVIAPAEDQWWTTDSRKGIDVPLGRAGATKLQNLTLGKGTSQHVLIAGKTGSGKSTLLHALIVNVALRYSPKEVELYLIDFKKGVEFKTYATHSLPHARVVAIESEREFGISVLQRLDAELKVRGDKYRLAGAQDVASYRAARPDEDLPRMLLLIDEFQEFFIEDDKLAQEASLLLDRLVRQGRAFGIHVHLGSQTLSGAYSLARSTLGQMAVRIALQCSESDAHLILSEENSAARLLSRPGEAIYNDANGLVEGNHIFQVVWLGDNQREKYLIQLAQLARDRGIKPTHKQIVFEGDAPATLDSNLGLEALLDPPSWPTLPRSVPAWLGDAIAIKDPTAAVFQPQSGSHLLLIGQQEESAIGAITGAILSLAAHYEPNTPNGARFLLLDGTPSDSPFAGKLARLESVLPHPFQVAGHRTLPTLVTEVAEEVERRRLEDPADQPAIYVIVMDLTRFRDLRKSEDDFGSYGSFGGAEKPPSPSKLFQNILREGPAVNVHVIAWCDTITNLNRTFDRQGLGEFEMRVLFQMSAGDSSQLIDSPAAGRLGPNRALFFSEEQGRLEKFRPYGLPDDAYLAGIKQRFDAKPHTEPPAPPENDANTGDDSELADASGVTP